MATDGFKDVVHKLREYGYKVYDLDSEDVPLVGKIEVLSLEHLMFLHDDLGEELIINTYHNRPTIEVYNSWRE